MMDTIVDHGVHTYSLVSDENFAEVVEQFSDNPTGKFDCENFCSQPDI
jgi:hypothetical protein